MACDSLAMTVRASRLRLILLGTALIFLVYLSRDAGTGHNIKGVVDRALDNFASQYYLSKDAQGDLVKIFEVQSFLLCLVRSAKWRTTMKGPKLVMPATCSSVPKMSLFPVEDICQRLPGKKLLLVGPETTHFLHSLWLDVVESRRNQTHTCPGKEYCTFHHICRSPSAFPQVSDTYDRAERKKKMPSDDFLRATRSALLQYTYSTTLYAAPNQSDMLYQLPLVDPESGVRQVSQFWLRRARKADVIILGRAPISAPLSTYTLSSGDWTFAYALCSQRLYLPSKFCRLSLSCALTNAALDLTFRNFLPSVMETLRTLSTDTSFQGSLRVWHGNWLIQPSCAAKGLSKDTKLLPDCLLCSYRFDLCLVDPWTYLYNVQVYLQDRLLPRILPHYGIIYLPLTFPILDHRFDPKGYDRPKDCIREPWPNFPEAVAQTFFSELSALLPS